jgi:hypothetical protein
MTALKMTPGQQKARAIEIALLQIFDGIQCDFVPADDPTAYDDIIEVLIPDRFDFAPVWVDLGQDGIMAPGVWLSRDQETASVGTGTRAFALIVQEVARLLILYGWAAPRPKHAKTPTTKA